MKRITLLALVALAIGSAAAMTVDASKAFMTASRTWFLSPKSYHIEYTTTAMGIPTESRCWIRRDAKKGEEALKVSVTKLELNVKVEDAYFELPKGCKVIDLNDAAVATKALVGGKLMPKRKK